MFTGIVECMGRVREIAHVDAAEAGGCSLTIENAAPVLADAHLGDSIAVQGVCLTVTAMGDEWFKVGLAPETLRKTNLGELAAGDAVNLERAMQAATRFGGHVVQGHVDGTVRLVARDPDPPNSVLLTFEDSPESSLLDLVVTKGYVSLDGTSLTVVSVDRARRRFSVMLIAYTQERVTLTRRPVGALVNLEVDPLGKYARDYFTQVLASPPPAFEAYIRRIVTSVISESR